MSVPNVSVVHICFMLPEQALMLSPTSLPYPKLIWHIPRSNGLSAGRYILYGHRDACPSQTNIMKQMSLKHLKLSQLLSYVCIALGHSEMKDIACSDSMLKKSCIKQSGLLLCDEAGVIVLLQNGTAEQSFCSYFHWAQIATGNFINAAMCTKRSARSFLSLL